MEKLKHFLLIDDSKATNFFNKTIIEKVACVEKVVIAENGKDALDYIEKGMIPEVIFLDINMPVMNGWEFISNYQKLDDKFKKSIIILMLGAELNQEEKKLVESIPEIHGFEEKMLTKNIVQKIVNNFFGSADTITSSTLDNMAS
ncbi:response regulator [Aquimarina sp. MMG016]|uniref:response regulator n=1 Tax=Aquimarina sp. MMG016 TaxID=2822690 RepID=UPI001B39FD89|nr:response regulator [Aquimarina sp. MMG016]MBQ4821707.1 response regulator [Aquimarina sp. MMG016]